MPNHLEVIPPTQENLQFPGGDITPDLALRAMTLLDQLTSDNSETVRHNMANLRLGEFSDWQCWPGQSENWGNVEYLADAWGATLLPDSTANKSTVTKMGFMYSVSFLKRARLLPLRFANFSDEVLDMSTFDRTAIKSFADEAWHGMHMSHPELYGTMAPLVRLTADAFDLRDEDRLILLDAGMALPYTMATTTRMEGYLKTELMGDRIPQ